MVALLVNNCLPAWRAWVTALMSLTLKLASASAATASLTYCAAQEGQPVQQRMSKCTLCIMVCRGGELALDWLVRLISSSSPGPPSPTARRRLISAVFFFTLASSAFSCASVSRIGCRLLSRSCRRACSVSLAARSCSTAACLTSAQTLQHLCLGQPLINTLYTEQRT